MSVRAYCEAEGFRENMYYYWQRKLREAACTCIAIAQPAVVATHNESSIVPKGWAICGSTKTADEGKTLPIEIGGCRVLAGLDVDPQLLAKVCRVLVSL